MDKVGWGQLLAAFVDGEIDAPRFERLFLDAFRANRDAPMPYAVDLTFYAVDAYCANPALRGPNDIDEVQLREEVRGYLARLDEAWPELAGGDEHNGQSGRGTAALPGAAKGCGLKGNT